MKLIYLSVLFVLISFSTSISFAQGTPKEISGYIKDIFGNSISSATISLQGTTISTRADYDGFYKLVKVRGEGRAVVAITAVGYLTETKSVLLDRNKIILDVQLKEDTKTIQEVSIIGLNENERHVQEIRRSGFNVSVIDLNKHANEATNLTQVLKRATGVTIREDGGLGSNFVFRINGLDAKIFIDGVPMENFGSSMSLNNIPVNLIDRVEVYKGVVPAFLGSDALGGAVNIITKKRARPFLDLSYTLGSFNTHQSALVSTYTNPKTNLSFRLNGFYNHSDNNYKMYTVEKHNVILNETVNNKFVPVSEVRRFNDAYTSAMGQMEVGVRDKSWADQFFVGVTYSQNHKENQLGAAVNAVYGGAWSESKYVMPTLSYKKNNFIVDRLFADIFTSVGYDTQHIRDTALYNYDWSTNWISNEIGSAPNEPIHNKLGLSNYLGRANFNYDFDAERTQSLNFNYNYNSSDRTTLDMIKNLDESGLSSYLGRHILGLSWQNQWFNKRLSNVFSLKYYRLDTWRDYDERKFDADYNLMSGAIVRQRNSKDFYSFSIASRYEIIRDGGWKLSYEGAYKLPSAEGLFGDGQNTIANWDLKAERSDNLNTGFYYNTFLNESNFLNLDLTGFYRFATDYINTRTVEYNGSQYFQQYNIPGVKLYGFSAETKYGFKDLIAVTLNGSYDRAIDNKKFTDETNQQISSSYGYQIPNRPWVYGNMDVSLIQNDWFQKGSRIQLSYIGQYTHWFYLTEAHLGSLESKDHIPSQTIHSAIVSYSWNRNKYNISFEGRNLTDERAYDNFRLQKPGRAFYLKLRVSLM